MFNSEKSMLMNCSLRNLFTTPNCRHKNMTNFYSCLLYSTAVLIAVNYCHYYWKITNHNFSRGCSYLLLFPREIVQFQNAHQNRQLEGALNLSLWLSWHSLLVLPKVWQFVYVQRPRHTTGVALLRWFPHRMWLIRLAQHRPDTAQQGTQLLLCDHFGKIKLKE